VGASQIRARILLRRIIFRLFFIFGAGFSADAAASPWSRLEGEILAVSRIDYFKTKPLDLNIDGAPAQGRFQRIQSHNYLEFGLTEGATIGGKLIYGTNFLTRGEETLAASGFTEIEAFAQHQIFRTPRHAVAARLTMAAPAGLDSSLRPDLAGGDYDIELSALYGASLAFRPVKLFAAAELGFRRRFGDPADQLRFLTTLGLEPDKRWLFLVDTFSVKSLGNEGAGGVDYDIYKIRPSVGWRATRTLMVQGGFEKEFAGRNVTRGRTYFIGLWTTF
jgi:hypothetical protein